MKINFQRVLVPLFIFLWWKSLYNSSSSGILSRDKVVKVKSWRTAVVDRLGGGRITMTICPLWFK